jgi:hypothetical protein
MEMDLMWIPVYRSWRLNDPLQGLEIMPRKMHVPLGFQVQHGRVGKGVDGINLDDVFLHRENPTVAQSD